MTKTYALYRGDDNICDGTIDEIAKKRHVKPETIKWYLSHVYQRRLAQRKHSRHAISLVKILDDDDDTKKATSHNNER